MGQERERKMYYKKTLLKLKKFTVYQGNWEMAIKTGSILAKLTGAQGHRGNLRKWSRSIRSPITVKQSSPAISMTSEVRDERAMSVERWGGEETQESFTKLECDSLKGKKGNLRYERTQESFRGRDKLGVCG